MEEWKELDTYDLPPDYFDDNNYIFEWRKEKVNNYKWDLHITTEDNNHMSLSGKLQIIKNIKEEGQEYRYRRPIPEKPSHEQLCKTKISLLQECKHNATNNEATEYLLSTVIFLLNKEVN